MPSDEPIVKVDALRTLVGGRTGFLRRRQPPIPAVNGVSLSVQRGEALGIVGESGCGKSTLGRTILGVLRESEGQILLNGKVVSGLPPRQARRARRDIQYVYQDAAASLDPWWRIGRSLHESLVIGGIGEERERKVDEIVAAVGLGPEIRNRYPHELSGGQLRRIALARILILSPQVVIFDEPTAGLDVSVQAAVLRLMRDLRERLQLTYMLISHDLSVVRLMCDRIAIMYLGKMVELAPTELIFGQPAHPYTRLLLEAAPRLDIKRADAPAETTGFEPPNPAKVPSGCAFRTRCPFAIAVCAEKAPTFETASTDHSVACHRWAELRSQLTEPARTSASENSAETSARPPFGNSSFLD